MKMLIYLWSKLPTTITIRKKCQHPKIWFLSFVMHWANFIWFCLQNTYQQHQLDDLLFLQLCIITLIHNIYRKSKYSAWNLKLKCFMFFFRIYIFKAFVNEILLFQSYLYIFVLGVPAVLWDWDPSEASTSLPTPFQWALQPASTGLRMGTRVCQRMGCK